MNVLILSDSHGILKNAQEVIDKYFNEVEALVFLGDCTEDMKEFSYRFINAGKAYYGVSGNCDFSGQEPDEKIFSLGGKRFFICHGHRYNVKMSYDRLVYRAMEAEADVCLFGHTHYPECFYEQGILIMNPGSISLPRGVRYPGFGIISISESGVSGKGYYKNKKEYGLYQDI